MRQTNVIEADEPIEEGSLSLLRAHSAEETGPEMTDELRSAIFTIWNSKDFLNFFKSYRLHIDDGNYYFMDDDVLQRVCKNNYRASTDDIIHMRTQTTGITETFFLLNSLRFRVIDVGGQQSQRKKWLGCFEGVTGVIFIASLSDYNEKLREDEEIDRMADSLKVFDSIVNAHYFRNSCFTLFLNKIDLFKEKLTRQSMSPTFPDYNRELSYEESLKFVELKFLARIKGQRQIFVHRTCATNTNYMERILASTIAAITQENVNAIGVS